MRLKLKENGQPNLCVSLVGCKDADKFALLAF